MEIYEIKSSLNELKDKFVVLKKKIDYDQLINEVKKMNDKMNKEDFWDDSQKASLFSKEYKKKKDTLDKMQEIKSKIDELEFFLEEFTDEKEEINNLHTNLENLVQEMEFKSLLNGEYDDNDVYLEIHPGAGGVESHDFALMILQMYEKYLLKNNIDYKIIDYHKGDVAGIKSATLQIKGDHLFGLLKGETGVHRLIRISPFDSGNRRHTSFASVKVTPILKDINYEIDEKDLKIDTYRSSGAGGQGVNTTDSAVRITHLPTKIVVSCQNQRSQIQNKEEALQVLKTKLFLLEEEKALKKSQDLTGELKTNSFGSQKRTYTMHPYKLVKDNVSGYESAQVNKVLAGDIEKFLYYNLAKTKE